MKRAALIGAILVALLVGGAQAAGELTLTVVSQTNSTITLGWTPQPGYGYLFSADGTLVSRTNDPSRSTVKFSKNFSTYEVAVIVKGATGTYPPATPPKNQCEDSADNDGDGKIDLADPGCTGPTDNDETDPAPVPTAQWYLSLSGNDSNPCTQSAPCRSFNRGYQVARLGDTVEVAAGAYPAQTIDDEASKDTAGDLPDVVIRPAAGATVTIASLLLGSSCCEEASGPDHLTIRGISDDSFNSGDCSWDSYGGDIYDITFDNVRTCNFTINHEQSAAQGNDVSDGLTIKNSELMGCRTGSGYSCGNNKIDGSDGFVFENNYVHDYQVTSSGDHFECMFISDTTSALIQRNRFAHCDYYNIFMQPCNPANGGRCVLQNITIQNNWFDETDNFENTHRDTAIEGTAANLLIRFNTFWNSGYSTSGSQNNVRVVGNIMGQTTCGLSGLSYEFNVFTHGASACGTSATQASAAALFVNAASLDAGGDYHLRGGTNIAVGFVTPDTGPFVVGDDIDLQTRNAPRDAGADER